MVKKKSFERLWHLSMREPAFVNLVCLVVEVDAFERTVTSPTVNTTEGVPLRNISELSGRS